MKIAMIAPEVFPVPPIRGGAVETLIEEVSTRLSGHEIHVFSIADPALPLEEQKGDRTYHRWAKTWWTRLLLSSWKLPFKQSNSRWYYWPYSWWVAKQLRILKPDVVWLHTRIQFVPWIRRAVPHARLILSVHNVSNFSGSRVWTPEAVNAVDMFTGCSRYLAEALVQAHPACTGKTQHLYNGVDPKEFAPSPDAEKRTQLHRQHGLGDGPVVLYAGRLVESKGAHVLIEAFKQLMAGGGTGQGARGRGTPTLLIVGGHTFSDGRSTPYIEQLRTQAEVCGDRVRFVGHVSREQIADYFLMSDILAFPSTWVEPFGMTILEAVSSGLPVVAFRQGGPAEIIQHGQTGLLVDPQAGAKGLAEALNTLICDRSMCETLGQAARRTVEERFTWDRMADELLRLSDGGVTRYRVLIAESGTGYGGSAKYLDELLSVLDRRRYDIAVVAAEEGPFITKIRTQGVPVYLRPSWRFPWGQQEGRTSRFETYLRYVLFGPMQLAIVPTIADWLKDHEIKLVHLNNEVLSHLPLLLAARMAGCRIVCHLHGWRAFTRTERWALRYVDELIAISDAGARYYSTQLQGRAVVAAPNGIILNGHITGLEMKRTRGRMHFGVSADQTVAVLIGRLVPWKGHEVFLKGLASARTHHPNLIGWIVGYDPSPGQEYLGRLKALAEDLGLSSRVRFVSWQEDVWSIYAAADLIVHASIKPEPFGLVVLEAIAAGKPVIATRSGGVVDIVVDQETGLLVEPGNSDQLSQAIVRLIEDRELAQRYVEQAAVRVKRVFTMERNAAQIAGVYDRLLSQVREVSP